MIETNGNRWTLKKEQRTIQHWRYDREALNRDEKSLDKAQRRGKWFVESVIPVVPLEEKCKCGGDIYGPLVPKGVSDSAWGMCSKCDREWKPRYRR